MTFIPQNFVANVPPTIKAAWLNSVDTALAGATTPAQLAALLPASGIYTPPGTGAVATTVSAKLAESISVLDFGATGNGSTDDTAAIQRAINAAVAAGGRSVYFPPGFYVVSSTINITGSVGLIGAGRAFTVIEWASTTLTVFNNTSDTAMYMSGIQMAGPVGATAGRMLQFMGNATANSFSVIRDCQFTRGFSQVYCVKASQLLFDGNYCSGFVQSGLHIENQFNADSGDSTVIGNVFANSPNTTTSVCLEQFSSGGLKITANKFNTGAYNFRLVMASGINTSDLLINSNSMENATVACISISSSGGGAIYTSIDISSNQISLTPAPIVLALTYAATSGVVIGANRINTTSQAGAVAIALAWGSGVSINGNTITSGAASQTAITLDANCSGNVGVNAYTGTWTAKITNSSASVYINPQSFFPTNTSGTITCSTTFGGIFEGSVAVTFPVAFDSVPIVSCTPGTISGGISAFPLSITKTGCTIQAYSVTSSGAGAAQYSVQGVA
jgi:hypothetical protein